MNQRRSFKTYRPFHVQREPRPVGHDGHVLGGLPQGLDHEGVADNHEEGGDEEGEEELVHGEVDPRYAKRENSYLQAF